MAIIFPPGNEGDQYTASNGIIYEFSDGAWRLAAGNVKAGVHVGTTPPNNPQAGDLWWHSGEADLKIYYIDPSSEQWVPASSPPDPYEENFVSTTGDTMTGRLTIVKEGLRLNKEDGTRHLTLSPNGGDYYTNIFAHNGNSGKSGIRLRVAPDDSTTGYKTGVSVNWNTHTVGSTEYPLETNVNYLKTPTSSHHAANKQYVDDAVAGSTSLNIPGRRYKYSNSYDGALPSGCFHVEGNGSIQLSRYDFDDVEMASTYSDSWQSSVKFVATVRNDSGNVKHAVACDKWYQGRDGNKHIRHEKKTMIKDGKSSLSAGTVYWIADGIYCV